MYSTVLDVRTALAPGGQSTGTATTLGDAQLADAINQADSIIRTYIGMLYLIPIQNFVIPAAGEVPEVPYEAAPEPVRYWSRDIAAYLATLTFKRNQDVNEDDPVRLRLNLAMLQLTMVRDGKSTLPFDPPANPSGESGVFVFNAYEGNLFGPDDFYLNEHRR